MIGVIIYLLALAFSNAYFGQGTGPIHFEGVGCSGLESALVQCNHLTSHDCYHYEDAGARCSIPGMVDFMKRLPF